MFSPIGHCAAPAGPAFASVFAVLQRDETLRRGKRVVRIWPRKRPLA